MDHVVLSLKALLWLLFGQRIKLGLCTLSLSTSPVLGLLSLTTRFYYSGLPSVWASLVAQMVKESACIAGDLDWEDPLKKGMATQLQHSGLEKSMDRGAWQATDHGVTKSWT